MFTPGHFLMHIETLTSIGNESQKHSYGKRFMTSPEQLTICVLSSLTRISRRQEMISGYFIWI